MCAIAIIDETKFKLAKEAVGMEDKEVLIKKYKELGGRVVEGKNEEIDPVKKVIGFFDPEKPKKKAKKAGKKGRPKKKKK